MDHVRLINDFVEGNLDKTKEDELFYMLSSNDGLRAELKQSIAIDKAFNKKASSFVPATKSAVGIFSALGFSIPTSAIASPIAAKTSVGSAFISKFWTHAATAIAAAGITAVMFLTFNSSGYKEQNNSALAANQSQVNETSENNASQSTTKADNINQAQKTSAGKQFKQNKASNQINNNSELSNLSNDNNQEHFNESENFFDKDLVKRNSFNANNYDEIAYLHNNNVSLAKPANYKIKEIDIYEKLGLSLEVRSSQFWTDPDANSFYSPTKPFHNMGASIFKDLGERFAVGLDIRQERFYQEFKGIDGENSYNYRQYPNYISLSLAARFKILDMGRLDLVSQLSLGAVATGFVGRPMIGFRYSPDPTYSFIIGGEYDILAFKHQDQYFFSDKYGLIYGVSFNF